MYARRFKIELYSKVYDESLNNIQKWRTGPDAGKSIDPYWFDDEHTILPFASSVALGNGYFLTASHSFDLLIKSPDAGVFWRIFAEKVYINGVEAKSDSWTHIRSWDYRAIFAEDYTLTPLKDLTIVKVDTPVSELDISPFVIFANKESLSKTLTSSVNIYLSGEASGESSGTFDSSTVDGQFNAIIKTAPGDSGGPVTASIGGTSYITGVLSAERVNLGVISYMNPIEYYNVMSQPIFGPTNSFQGVQPDLIISTTGATDNFYRGTKKKASFILDESYSALMTGSGGDIINTGSGTENFIFTQDLIGEVDEGTTFVVSPGYDYIVGASANDRLAILKDRLFKYQGSSSGTSEIIKLKGAITVSTGEGFFGDFAPYYADRELQGDYYVTYKKMKNEGRTDLIIHVEAPDESSGPAYRGSRFKESLWTGTIHVVDYKEGDLGLRFIDGKSEEVQDDPNNVWKTFLSDFESTSYTNDYKGDTWNGVKSSYHSWDTIIGPSYSDINWYLENILSTYVDNPDLSMGQPVKSAPPKEVGNVVGTQNSDLIDGTDGDDYLDGKGGNDHLRGGEGSDTLDGGGGKDRLVGGTGDDTMMGGEGDDTFFVDSSSDNIIELSGNGIDTIYTSVDYILIAGAEVEIVRISAVNGVSLTGNELDQIIVGGYRDDTLDGGGGADTIIGGTGDDVFVFSSNLGPQNISRLIEFSSGHDKIQLSKNIFTSIVSGILSENAFKVLSSTESAIDADDRIVYNNKTGALYYDADGSKSDAAMAQFAIIENKSEITFTDFIFT